MRKCLWLLAVCGVALAGSAARAQAPSAFGGVNPANLIFKPVDTTKNVVSIAPPQQIGLSNFSLGSLFPNHPFNFFNNKTLGASPYPTAAQMPTAAQWLAPFQYRRAFQN
jgi:hypothetical protein